MSENPLKNISPAKFGKVLKHFGYKHVRTAGGHDIWNKPGARRPVTFPNHTNPLTEFVVKNGISCMRISREEFIKVLKKM